MKLALIVTAFMAVSGLTTLVWAAGFDPQGVAHWPWRDIALLVLPVIGTTLIRLKMVLRRATTD